MLNMFRTLIHWGGIRVVGWSTACASAYHTDTSPTSNTETPTHIEAQMLQPATQIPPQPSHTDTPTHIETRTHNHCGDTIEKSQAPDDGCINPLTTKDPYSGRTAPLISKRCILYIYSTNIGTEYFKHGIYSPFFNLKYAVCFIMLTYSVPVLFTFYIQGVLKLKK